MTERNHTTVMLDEKGLPYVPVYMGRARPWISRAVDSEYTYAPKQLEASKYHKHYASMGFSMFGVGDELEVCSDKDGYIQLAQPGSEEREVWFREKLVYPDFMRLLYDVYLLRVLVRGKDPGLIIVRAQDFYDARRALREWQAREEVPIPDKDGVYRRKIRLPVHEVIFYAEPGVSEQDPMCLVEALAPGGANCDMEFIQRFRSRGDMPALPHINLS